MKMDEEVTVYLFHVKAGLISLMDQGNGWMEPLLESVMDATSQTVWEFCNENPNLWILYANTTKKKVAKLFQETRNMKKFRVQKKKMTKEEYKAFLNHHRSTSLYDDCTLITKGEPNYLSSNGNEYHEVAVPCTQFEYSIIECEEEFSSILIDELDERMQEHRDTFSILFKCGTKKVRRVLMRLRIKKFLDVIDYLYSDDNFKDESFGECFNGLDELYIIIKYFGDTF